MLVPPQDPRAHADAMIELLDSESKRKQLGERYLEKVKKQYSSGAVIEQLSEIYDTVLAQ
jgi:glycosyltransferase involved in cell wall biosynthesis